MSGIASGGMENLYFREFMAFNFLPTRYMDPSWWPCDSLSVNQLSRIARNPRCHPHLSRFFLKHAGIAPEPQVDLVPEAVLFVPMHRQRLQRLAFLAGVTLLSPAIAGVLRGEHRRMIKCEIGARDFEFAVTRGRFLLQHARVKDVLPAAPLTDFGDLEHDCRRLGVGALASALCEAPVAVVRRLQLKFPKALVERDWRPLAAKPMEFLRLFTLLDRQVSGA